MDSSEVKRRFLLLEKSSIPVDGPGNLKLQSLLLLKKAALDIGSRKQGTRATVIGASTAQARTEVAEAGLGRPISDLAADLALVSPCWTFLAFLHFHPLDGLKFWHKGI